MFSGYIPLAPTASPWATGYFTQTGTVDLQAAAAIAPDVAAGEAASLPRAVPVNTYGLPLLNSRAGGTGLELFIDFARDDVAAGFGPFSLDADKTNYNLAEELAIYACWRNLVGFFSQFNVNVTTVLPPTGGADPNFAWVQVSNDFDGGAAYVNSLTKSGPTGRVNSGNATDRVSGITHEYGHILGLAHQADYDKYGNVVNEYSNADGYRNVPIMGIDYNGQPNSRWWFGRGQWQTAGVDIQDDLQVVANTVSSVVGGDGYRADDFANTLAAAATLASGAQQFDGYLERYSDADVFKITPATASNWNFTATPLYGSQAQPKLELLDASGNVIAARDDAALRNGPTNEQFLNVNLAAGTYYVRVSSSGDYGELGYYKLAAAPLPSFFVSNDLGAPHVDGSVSYDPSTGIFTQSAGGTDIWNASDQFRYTYETLSGDGSITARIDGLDNIGTYTKGGIMIRQSTSANSANVYMGLKPDGTVETIRRGSAGATATSLAVPGTGPWVRLTRSGNLFSLQTSSDGVNWSAAVATTIVMTNPVLIGLASCAWSSRYEAFTTYSNVSVTGNVTPAAPTYNALSAPATLTATQATGANTSINLTWSAVAGAIGGYRIERSVDGVNFGPLTTVAAGATSYIDTNPWGSMRWFYRVAASDGTSFYSAPSPIASAVNKPNTPGTPGYTAPVIGRGTTELDLNWLDVQGETGYRIERSTDGVNFTTVITTAANQTSYNMLGLAAGTGYAIRITPVTNVGDGLTTPLVINTATRMAAVSNLRFTTKSSASMVIAWDDSPRETNFRVQRSTDGVNWATATNTAQNVTTYTDNSVTAGSEYYYRVTPYDAAFDGFSATVFAAAPAASLPSGWTNTDIGAVAGSGAGVNTGAGAWTTVSGGNDIIGTADAFNFTYRALDAVTDNSTAIVARVAAVETTSNAAKAGLVIRQGLAANSKSIAIMINAAGTFGIDVRTRTAAGVNTGYSQALASVTAPYWLRLSRSGNTVTAAYSADGSAWMTASTINNFALSGTFYLGLGVTSASTTQLNTSTFTNVGVGALTGTPTVATAANATPNPVTGTTADLSVLGADDGGEAALTYTWNATGPATVNYTVNGSNAAKNTTATFSASGNYVFTVQIIDSGGLFTTSIVNVTVQSTLTGISVTPGAPTIGAGTTQQLAASAVDQFGNAMVSQPTFNWSVLQGGGTVNASGLYIAPASAALGVVRATSGSISGAANVNVVDVNEAIVWYKFNESSGTMAYDNSGHNRPATLTGAAAFAAGTSGNALSLTGGNAGLPSGIVSAVTGDFTIAAWVKLGSIDTWSRIFDFGTGTNVYMFLTPSAGGTNLPRFAITTGSSGGEQVVNSSVAIAANTWTHVAVRLTGNTAALFINGVQRGSNAAVTLRPSSLGSTNQNYIGKSQWPDPALNGSVDDFRIYGRSLWATEITSLSATSRLAYVFNNRLYVDFNGAGITLGTSGSNVTVSSGATNLSFASSTFADILVTGLSTADDLTIQNTLPKPLSYASGTGDDALSVTGSTLAFSGDAGVASASLTVNVTDAGSSISFAGRQHLAALNISTAGTASVIAAASPASAAVLNIGALSFSGANSRFDLGNNELLTSTALGAVRAQIAGGQMWTSAPGGALGLMDLGNGQTDVRFTLLGDTDLNGAVDVSDLGNLASNYGKASGAIWNQGDFDYNDRIDVADLGSLASYYGSSLGFISETILAAAPSGIVWSAHSSPSLLSLTAPSPMAVPVPAIPFSQQPLSRLSLAELLDLWE